MEDFPKDYGKFAFDVWGHPGSKIEGSDLKRDYCPKCGEPIRVVDAAVMNICLDCQPTGSPGKSAGRSTYETAIGYHGGQFNAGEW